MLSTHKVAPLISGSGQSTQETAYNHQQVEEEGDEDDGKGQSGDQKQAEQEERASQEPVDVATVPDLASWVAAKAATKRIVAKELDSDRRRTEIAGHREPRDGGDGESGNEQVVESPSVTRNSHGPDQETKSGSCHETEDGPGPVATPAAEMDVCIWRVDLKRTAGSPSDESCVHDGAKLSALTAEGSDGNVENCFRVGFSTILRMR